MEKQKTKRREWVKTAAIVFLAVLLVLTFFSNTIMNRSLPEVAAQYVSSGSINARIRGTGQVSANESYDVTLSQTRKIRSVMVKVGQQVTAGDTLFILEADESDELKQAQKTLEDMELNYQKSLITLSNGNSTEDRGVQKLQNAYNEALAAYRLYSNMDPSQLKLALEKAKAQYTELQRYAEDVAKELASAQQDLADAEAAAAGVEAQIADLEQEIESCSATISGLNAAMDTLNRDKYIHEGNYSELADYATYYDTGNATPSIRMAAYAEDPATLNRILTAAGQPELSEDKLRELSEAYSVLTKDLAAVTDLLGKDPITGGVNDEINLQKLYDAVKSTAEKKTTELENETQRMQREIESLQKSTGAVTLLKQKVEEYTTMSQRAQREAEDQQAVVEQYQSGVSAGETLKAAQEALEDAVFQANLGSTDSLDIQAAKKAIEEQKKVVEELTQQADGQEVVANVSGTISAINVTAGNTAGAETALASITVADRGYTVKISVTTEQARQVRVGDTAQVTNYYWGDISATLENIASDPQSMGKNKLLIFRINGDGVEAGTNLTLSIGQKSANYDCLVPNSAIRSDSNGSFVLVVTAKSSPLGNRYVATRADIQVLASDDTMSAVSGLANGDFVITTSTKPIEAGNQVRLVDNG